MARCPICFTELGYWTDDPILTKFGLAGPDYIGYTFYNWRHIQELQDIRIQQEIDVGIPVGERTVFTPASAKNFYRIVHIMELRESTEKILNKTGFTKEDYFNYDEEGTEYNTEGHQLDWNDVNLKAKEWIRAIHIEDLRHPIQFIKPSPLLFKMTSVVGGNDYYLVDTTITPDLSRTIDSEDIYKPNDTPWKADPGDPRYDANYWWGWHRYSFGYIYDLYLSTYERDQVITDYYVLNETTMAEWPQYDYELHTTDPGTPSKLINKESAQGWIIHQWGGFLQEKHLKKTNWNLDEIILVEGGNPSPPGYPFYNETPISPPEWRQWYTSGIGWLDYNNYGFWGESTEGLGDTFWGICLFP